MWLLDLHYKYIYMYIIIMPFYSNSCWTKTRDSNRRPRSLSRRCRRRGEGRSAAASCVSSLAISRKSLSTLSASLAEVSRKCISWRLANSSPMWSGISREFVLSFLFPEKKNHTQKIKDWAFYDVLNYPLAPPCPRNPQVTTGMTGLGSHNDEIMWEKTLPTRYVRTRS